MGASRDAAMSEALLERKLRRKVEEAHRRSLEEKVLMTRQASGVAASGAPPT
jgi:hypothetical protein